MKFTWAYKWGIIHDRTLSTMLYSPITYMMIFKTHRKVSDFSRPNHYDNIILYGLSN